MQGKTVFRINLYFCVVFVAFMYIMPIVFAVFVHSSESNYNSFGTL